MARKAAPKKPERLTRAKPKPKAEVELLAEPRVRAGAGVGDAMPTKLRLATLDDTNNVPFDQLANAASGVGLPLFAATTEYSQGQQIAHGGQLYAALVDFTSGASFNAGDWLRLGQLPSSVARASQLIVLPAPSGGDDAAIINPIIAAAAAAPGSKVIAAPGTYLANSGPIIEYPGIDYDWSLATVAQSATPGTPLFVNKANTSLGVAATASDVNATGQVNAVWTVTAGAETGGSGIWSFVWNGQTWTTPAIAFNASAATIQAAIQAATDVNGQQFPFQCAVCAGGALGTASVMVTFQYDVAGPVTSFQIATNSYTGGTGPTFTSTTSGVAGNTFITSAGLSAVAVVGQGISVDQAGLQPDNPALTAVVGSVAGTQINLVDPAFGTPVSVLSSVTGGSAKLINRDFQISNRGGRIVRSDTTSQSTSTNTAFEGACVTVFKWHDGFSWDHVSVSASPNLIGGGETFKYAFDLGQAANFAITNVTLNVVSDGVHMEGNCYNGTVRTIRGVTGDDGVALTPANFPGDATTRGSLSDIDISDIHINPTLGAAVAIYGGPCTSTRRVSVRGIYGQLTNGQLAFRLGVGTHPQTAGGKTTNITVSEIHAVPGGSNGLVTINSPCAGRITIDGLYFDTSLASTLKGVVVSPSTLAPASVDHLTINRVRCGNLLAGGGILNVNNSRVGRCSFSDWDVVCTQTAAQVIYVTGTAPSIGRMMLSNMNLEGQGAGGVIDAKSSITTAASIGAIHVSNVHAHNFGNFLLTDLPGTTVFCSNLDLRSVTNLCNAGADAVGVRFIGSISTDQTLAALAVTAGGSVSVDSPRLHCSTAQVTPITGDRFYNYQATSTVPVGPVVWDGTRYQSARSFNLAAGGPSPLVAGTLTIANTAITATSIIRVSRIGPAGTVGILGVVLTAGTGFTINSYTGSGLTVQTLDTSKVWWEIVRYA